MNQQHWPTIIFNMELLQAFEILLAMDGKYDPQLINAAMFFMWVYDELKCRYPEIEHLLKQTDLTDQAKIDKAKMIFGLET